VTTPDRQSSILIVDDDERLVATIRRALIYEGYRVRTATTGLVGLELARDDPPDLVVLDVMLPGLDGLEVARRLAAGGQVPVLMLSARDQVADRVAGLEAGADDYLTKPFALEELLARVKARLRHRAGPLDDIPAVLHFADLSLDTGTRQANRGGRLIDLTTKEYELLALLMRYPRRVLTHAYLLQQVWGYDFDGESNVVPVFVGQVRQKLEAAGEPRLIHTVRRAGYVLRE
jgi:two-component system, OmpR family, response regulator MprA